MTKQEFLEHAYGERYQDIKDTMNEDGWFYKRNGLNGGVFPLETLDIKSNNIRKVRGEISHDGKDPKYPFMYRLKVLQGLETNNGWIKIEGPDTLPAVGETVEFCHFDPLKPKSYSYDRGSYRPSYNREERKKEEAKGRYWFEDIQDEQPTRYGDITHWRPIADIPSPLY